MKGLYVILILKLGRLLWIFVGALLVAGIETVWHGKIAPNYYKDVQTWDYNNNQYNIEFKKGDTLGWFNFGSTIVNLFPENKVSFSFDEKKLTYTSKSRFSFNH